MSNLSILVVDDELEIREVYSIILQEEGYDVQTAKSGEECLEIIHQKYFDLIITDVRMPGINGIQLIDKIRELSPDTAVIVITGYGNVESAVEAMKKNAFGYMIKGNNPEELLIEIKKYNRIRTLENETKRITEIYMNSNWFGDTNSLSYKSTLKLAQRAAESNSNIVITGESGTGKEVLANYIHRLSNRRKSPFVEVNCQVFSDNTIESELFGHERGSFTGAYERRLGRFEEASGGTLFLDEVGDLSPMVQTKLLRVLDTKTFARMGNNKRLKVDFRLICATHRNLLEEVETGNFREDLYFRINTIEIKVPALRERKEDIPGLISFFLGKFKREMKKPNIVISNETMDYLMEYQYPGNIRELKNIIERMVVLGDEEIIKKQLFEKSNSIRSSISETESLMDEPISLKEYRKKLEKEYIIKIIQFCKKDLNKTAEVLGITKRQLYNLIKELSI